MQNRSNIPLFMAVVVSWSLALSAVHIHPRVDIGPHEDGPVLHQQANYCTACACQLGGVPVAADAEAESLNPVDTVAHVQYTPPPAPVYDAAGGRSPPFLPTA